MPPSGVADRGLPLLFYGDSYRFPDIFHTIRFLAPDPQISLEQRELTSRRKRPAVLDQA